MVTRLARRLRTASGAIRTVVVIAGGVAATTVAVVTTVVAGGGGGGGSCTTTLSSGGNVATALTGVAAGGTVCLNAGTYTYAGTVSKTSPTTVTGAAGVANTQITFSSLSFAAGNNNLTFDGVTVSADASISNATNITLTNSRVIPPGSMCLSASSSNRNIVIDNVDFGNTDQAPCGEGRLDISGSATASGILVRFSKFGPNGAGDGIQLHAGIGGVTIGPGNQFVGIVEEACGAVHCDSIQPFGTSNDTYIGNFFYNDSTILAGFDCLSGGGGASPLTWTNNVAYQQPASQAGAAQIPCGNNDTVTHNTFGPGTDFQIYGGNQNGSSTGGLIRDNIFQGGCATNSPSATIDHNLSNSGCTGGTGGQTGTPTYVGGTTPLTWAGFALSCPASLGCGTASDGTNKGATSFG